MNHQDYGRDNPENPSNQPNGGKVMEALSVIAVP
jgi:hypothetical protein